MRIQKNLSHIGRVNEDYNEALDSFRKAIQIRRDFSGNNHPEIAVAYCDMGHKRGEYDEVIEYHEKAIKINEQIVGDKHPDTA